MEIDPDVIRSDTADVIYGWGHGEGAESRPTNDKSVVRYDRIGCKFIPYATGKLLFLLEK